MRVFTLRALFCCRPKKSGSVRMLFSFFLIALCMLTVSLLFVRRETGSSSSLKAACCGQPEDNSTRMTLAAPKAEWTRSSVNEQPHFENTPVIPVQQHKTTLRTRTTPMRYCFLLILVSSAPGNVDRRRFIRGSWGADSAIIPRWKTVFLLGLTTNQTQSDLLLKEEEAYRDLIVADFIDHYYNLTLKIQMGFEWATKYCNFSFLLKADDDAVVIPWAVVSVLKEDSLPRNKLYMGLTDPRPFVKRLGKWGITLEEYPGATYPPFCAGFSYVLSADVVSVFVELFDVVPFFKVDDVYVGMLAEKAGVEVLRNYGFQLARDCVLQSNTLAIHVYTIECMTILFRVASERRMAQNIPIH